MEVCFRLLSQGGLWRTLEQKAGMFPALLSHCLTCRHVRRSSHFVCRPPPHHSLEISAIGGCRGLLLQTSSRNSFSWHIHRHRVTETSQASLSSVVPVFVVMKFDKEGNVTSFERKKTELYQELCLQARDLRFQHVTSIMARNNCIIIRMESLKAVVTPQCLLILDFRGMGLERWLVRELGPQLAGDGALATYSLPFEFRAIEAILQHRVNILQARLNEVQPQILDTLESLVDPKLLSADRSKLHILLQNSKSLSELETDIKVFKESLLKILDEEELVDELCLTKWTDPQVFKIFQLSPLEGDSGSKSSRLAVGGLPVRSPAWAVSKCP
ncbi:magnesium transporter MRS2 homolog, mitochondrial isoform X4 [Conger conger]|uniref:magnesium transporter MRS2 homolog, mitochondrial isoform X4 n=1 Tax=Conger conger TaxID=82655 RepID=UPI002A5A938F|nr:magnesium transporter MRS2 homolog, mitochondrial isoform X4 [Conger conger]